MFCPKCGTNVPEGSKFCESCGNNMQLSEQSIQQESPQESQQESPRPTYNPNPAPAYQPQPRPQPAPAYINNTVNIVDPRDKPYGIGGWLGSILLSLIPFVGFILMLVWAFGGNTNKSKKNWAIAMLIFWVIAIILGILIYASLFAALGGILDQMGSFEEFMG